MRRLEWGWAHRLLPLASRRLWAAAVLLEVVRVVEMVVNDIDPKYRTAGPCYKVATPNRALTLTLTLIIIFQ